MGIDPGTKVTGYGIVSLQGAKISYVRHGDLRAKASKPFMERLYDLSLAVRDLIDEIQPQAVAVENIFLGRNVDSAFKLGHLRGICISEAMSVGAQVVEYMPRAVKKGITGQGGATKEQVQMLLYAQLGIRARGESLDASDALSLAYHHAIQLTIKQRRREINL